MNVKTLSPAQSLRPAFRKAKVSRTSIERMKTELPLLLDRTTGKVSESTLRDHLQTFLRGVAYPDKDFLIQSEVRRMDTVIHDGPKRKDPIGVIIEAKTTENKGEMFDAGKPNVKSLHELVLYFMRERETGNTAVKQLIITDGDTIHLFADAEFERIFWNKKRFRKDVLAADADQGKNNPIVYEIIQRHVATTDEELLCTTLHLGKFRKYCEDGDTGTDHRLLNLCKLLSPAHLLRRPFAGDSNHLDKGFYRELLHIIGLEEFTEDSKGNRKKKGSGKKVIARAEGANRHPASLLENTLQVAAKENRFRKVSSFSTYGNSEEDRQFAVGLELCLTWVNRVLFLKLLETQLIGYHDNATDYRFLTTPRIPDFDALNTLFFDVLNKPVGQREAIVSGFANVPYLNSSLFEISPLEDEVLRVNSLKDQFLLPLADRSVLAGKGAPTELRPLDYLFRFLDAYDFGGEGRASIQEDNKKLINASVLGLIFEKINGYRDGSFYTPGFITEYMCRETIRRAVVQKFRADTGAFAGFDSEVYADLKNYLARDNYKTDVRTAANALVNTVTVCDPAVGSGHFLVSALNELIATKSDLGILGADAGAKEVGISAEVANDELLVSDRKTGELYEYRVTTLAGGQLSVQPDVQAVQQTLFHEKRTLIENCLFGVDLNPNSVKICRLRLWIELLKNAYYQFPDKTNTTLPKNTAEGSSLSPGEGPREKLPDARPHLQTLPNIDINIKQGNSLISRFALDDDLGTALGDSGLTMNDYRQAVKDYHRASGSDEKQRLLDLIAEVKTNFSSHISRNDKKIKILASARGRMLKLESMLEMGDLFGSVDKKKIEKELRPLRNRVAKLEEEVEGIRTNAIYQNAFEWRFEFPAVLGSDGGYLGFDVVVGNPPYGVTFTSGDKSYFKKYFKTIVGKYDSYGFFIEKGINILQQKGGLNFIVPHTWLTVSEAKTLRRFVLEKGNIELIYRLNTNVFDEATVDTIIFEYQKANPTDFNEKINVKILPLEIRNSNVNLYSLQGYYHTRSRYKIEDKFNILLKPDELQILDKFKPFSKLIDITEMSVGIQAYDSYAGQSKEIISSRAYHSTKPLDETYKRELNGRDISRYEINYPEEAYVSYGEWLAHPRNIKYFTGERILIREITNKQPYMIHAALVQEDFVNYKSILNLIPNSSQSNMWVILGILNSKLISWIYLKSSNKLATNTFPRISLHDLKRIPIPHFEAKSRIGLLSERIQDTNTTDTTALEAEIDVLVYKLYGLTYAEVLVVDPGFGLEEAVYDKMEVV